MDNQCKKSYDKLCDGIPLAKGFSEEEFRAGMRYKPRPGELFIVTFPRSGTTWMHYMVLLILRRGKLSDDPLDFYVGCPYLEMTGSKAADYMDAAGVARSHYPYHKMPMSKEAKYIYVCRNVKDCAVSLGTYLGMEFDEFFEDFIKGDIAYGDYFDHVIGWYEHRNDPNVYLVTYENLKKDPRGEIIKLARFIGKEHEKAILDDPNIMDDILRYSSFEFMEKHTNEIMETFTKGEVVLSNEGKTMPSGMKKLQEASKLLGVDNVILPKSKFVRKGEVGDWKNYFNADQLRRLKARMEEKTAGSDVMSLWK